MKLKIVMAFIVVSVSSLASTNLTQKISIIGKDLTAAEFLAEVSKQAKVKFVVDPKAELPKHISMVSKDDSLKSVLDTFAVKQDVSWRVIDENTIKISPTQSE